MTSKFAAVCGLVITLSACSAGVEPSRKATVEFYRLLQSGNTQGIEAMGRSAFRHAEIQELWGRYQRALPRLGPLRSYRIVDVARPVLWFGPVSVKVEAKYEKDERTEKLTWVTRDGKTELLLVSVIGKSAQM